MNDCDNDIVLGVTIRKNQILLVRRKRNNEGLTWNIPGGTVRKGENLRQAVAREVKEETGIGVNVCKTIGSRVHPLTKKRITYYECECRSQEEQISIVSNDHDLCEITWIDINEAIGLLPNLYCKVKEYFIQKGTL